MKRTKYTAPRIEISYIDTTLTICAGSDNILIDNKATDFSKSGNGDGSDQASKNGEWDDETDY
jgi:hypothetical protein